LLNFSQEDLVKELKKKENEVISKNETVMLKNYEFFVKNCSPESGVLMKSSIINVENRDILNIQKVQIAIIKKNLQEMGFEEDSVFQNYVHQQIYKPYFLSGVAKYIERGEMFKIEGIEFCILNCNPEEGFVTKDTQVNLLFGMSTDKCLEKIKNADLKYAMQLSRQIDLESVDIQTSNSAYELNFNNNSDVFSNQIVDDINSNINSSSTDNEISLEDNRIIFNSDSVGNLVSRIINRNTEDREMLRNAINNRRNSSGNVPSLNQAESGISQNLTNQFNQVSLEDEDYISSTNSTQNQQQIQQNQSQAEEYDLQMFIYSLPELVVDKNYLDYIECKKLSLENITKCMICYCDFELDETLKTLPCSK